jgi:hypothetical protein
MSLGEETANYHLNLYQILIHDFFGFMFLWLSCKLSFVYVTILISFFCNLQNAFQITYFLWIWVMKRSSLDFA